MISDQDVRKDLYNAVNKEWQDSAEIPADKVRIGGFNDLTVKNEELLMADLQAFSQGEKTLDSAYADAFITYYNLAKDFAHRDALAAKPLTDELQEVLELKSIKDLEAKFSKFLLKDYSLPFYFYVDSDYNNSSINTLYLAVPRLILPDKTYYSGNNPRAQKLLDTYRESGINYLELLGFESTEANEIVDKAIKFDSLLVPIVRSNEENANRSLANNPRTIDEVEAYLDNFSFKKVISELINNDVTGLIVRQPKFFENLHNIFVEENLELLKSWIYLNTALGFSNLLSEDLRQAGAKYKLSLTGQAELDNQDKASYYLAKNKFSQVLGNYYGETYFGTKARDNVRAMIDNMISVYKSRLSSNEWLSPETIKQAINKLDKMEVMVGYPDYYPAEYEYMKIDPQLNLFENTLNLNVVANKYNYSQYGKQYDKTRWSMPADMVNAYFMPSANLICFPAGILQAPFYDLEQGASKNYGGIGAVIAHEISHAFDNNGSKFDAEGSMNNWWTDEDYKNFEARTESVVQQYQGLPFADSEVNGRLTLSENIADLGGLTCALGALKREGDYDLRDFFLNWSRVWREKARPEFQTMKLSTDVHAPAYWRANMVPQNLDDFHQTFSTQEGDPMYLAKEDRICIW